MVPAAGGTPFIWERSHVLTDHVLTDSESVKIFKPERRVEAHGRIDRLSRQIQSIRLARGTRPRSRFTHFAAGRLEGLSPREGALEQRSATVKINGRSA